MWLMKNKDEYRIQYHCHMILVALHVGVSWFYYFRDKESNKLMKEMEKRAAAEAAATPQGDNARGITTPSTLLPATDPTIIEQNKLGSQSKRTAISFGFGVIKPKRPNMAHGRGFGA